MKARRLKLKIYGWVQGVGFRILAVRKAQNLNLTGWVRNAEGGTVEIVAEGETEALTRFYEWCQKGPPLSRVEKVEVEWGFYEGGFQNFKVIP